MPAPAPTDPRFLKARGPCRRATLPGLVLTGVGTAALAAGIAIGATTLVTGLAAIVTGQVMRRHAARATVRMVPGGLVF